MTKKLRISPAEREILWILSEAEEEDISALINAVYIKFPTLSRREMLMTFEYALRKMSQEELIELCTEILDNGRQLLPVNDEQVSKLLSVSRFLKWDTEQGSWSWDLNQYGQQITIVTLTEKGKEILRR